MPCARARASCCGPRKRRRDFPVDSLKTAQTASEGSASGGTTPWPATRGFGASSATDIDEAFARLAQRPLGALVVTADGFLIGRQDQLVALASRYAVPTIYPLSQYVAAGGLMSYGASLRDAFCQTGLYVGKILKGATPADLPVIQPTKFELVINLKTTTALCLTVTPNLRDLADEVIE